MKGQPFETVPVHLVRGEQREQAFTSVNPAGYVPVLELDDGTRLTQSLAIIDWLEARWPQPALLPQDPLSRAHVLAATHTLASDTQPVTNSGVVALMRAEFAVEQKASIAWMDHWIERGLLAFAAMLPPDTPFCFGDAPGLADICLVPQLYNAHRWGVDMVGPLRRLTEIETRCLAHPAFANAAPERQPDAQA